MTRAATLALAALALAASAWLALRKGETRAPIAPAASETRAPGSSVGESSVAESNAALARAAVALALPPAAAREPAAERRARVAGRVEVQGGIPEGERALVVARLRREGVPLARSPRVEAPVAPDGSFALEVPEGTAAVRLALRGELLVLRQPVDVAPGTEDVVLRPELRALLRGWVHRAGATLGPSSCEEPPIQVRCSGGGGSATDAAGGFRLAVEPGRPLVLEAWTENAEATKEEPRRARSEASLALDALTPGEVRDVELQLLPFAAPRGVVVDSRGDAVEGATVSARRARDGAAPEAFARTGPDGRFALEELAPGDWLVTARASDRFGASEAVALPADAGRELRLVLAAPAIVRGRVLGPDGEPVGRALVLDLHARPIVGESKAGAPPSSIRVGGLTLALDDSAPDLRPAFADAGGRFELAADLPRLRLSAFAPELALAAPLDLELRPGDVVEDVVLRLRPTCVLRGTAVDEDGRPLLGTLEFRAADGLELFVALSEGALDAEHLPPGRATLSLRADPSAGGAHGSFEVELDPGRETEVELVFSGERFW